MESAIHGPAVKKAREARKLSQTEVANGVGLNRVYYSLFEAGRYVLNADEQERLSAFLSELGIQHAEVAGSPTNGDRGQAKPTGAPENREVAQDEPDGESQDDDADTRLESASRALHDLREAAETAGIKSKRTAGLVSAATEALEALDYVDLLSIAEQFGVPIDGLLSVNEFQALALAEMQLWESRAAGVLICESLYGELWRSVCFDELKEIEAVLRRSLPSGEQVSYRERSFFDSIFGDAEEFCPRRRADLAPYITMVASERRAPAFIAVSARASSAA